MAAGDCFIQAVKLLFSNNVPPVLFEGENAGTVQLSLYKFDLEMVVRDSDAIASGTAPIARELTNSKMSFKHTGIVVESPLVFAQFSSRKRSHSVKIDAFSSLSNYGNPIFALNFIFFSPRRRVT